MNKRRREQIQAIVSSLDYTIKKMEGQETARYHRARYNQKRREAHDKLIRRVYQTGEWWLLTDVYEMHQARAYFAVVGG